MKYYTVSLDGIDKVGKSTLVKYLAKMSNYTLNILDRGPITNIVWNEIQKRDVQYDLNMWKTTLFVRLVAEEADWNIRCAINNEPPMPLEFKDMNSRYDEVFADFREHGFKTLEYNTTRYTPFQIASMIIYELNCLNTDNT